MRLINMPKQRPSVLVTGPCKTLRFAWWATRFMLRKHNIDVHYACPGRALKYTSYDGIIIGGGDDIEPENYGVIRNPDDLESKQLKRSYDPARDAFELKILDRALKSNVPILGICRGAQLLNVALGGTLYQDIRSMRSATPNRRSIRKIKRVTLEKDSNLAHAMDSDSCEVNSLHEQAIDKLGYNLRAVAADRDHFIQAIESVSRPFVMGVQWHPEYLPCEQVQQNLMASFVENVHLYHRGLALEGEEVAA